MAEEQKQLTELLDTFNEQHPSLAEQLAIVPMIPSASLPAGYKASLSTDSTTQPSGLAFVGTGTGRDH